MNSYKEFFCISQDGECGTEEILTRFTVDMNDVSYYHEELDDEDRLNRTCIVLKSSREPLIFDIEYDKFKKIHNEFMERC